MNRQAVEKVYKNEGDKHVIWAQVSFPRAITGASVSD